MALYVISLVVLISSITQNGLAQLQLHPNPLQLTKGATSGSVQVTCGIPGGVTASTVYAIAISRYLKSAPTTKQRLARADVVVNQGQAAVDATSGLTHNTATVSGSTSQKSMTLTLTQAKCEDAGTYVCRIPYIAATGDDTQIQNIDVRDNFTVIVFPGNIVTSVSPDHDVYVVNDTVELLCNASIGSYDSQEDLRWSWEYFDVQYLTWRPVQTSPQSDIRVDPPTPVSDTCYYHQFSYLTLRLTSEDSQRQYRCTLQKNDNLLLASISLGIVSLGVDNHTTTAHNEKTVTPVPEADSDRKMLDYQTVFEIETKNSSEPKID